MPRIEWDKPQRPAWVPALDKIIMSDEPFFKERGPMVLAHKIGHREHDKVLSGTDPLVDLYQERDAWIFALKGLPPEEIDLGFIEDILTTCVDAVEEEYRETSHELGRAYNIKRKVMRLAKDKKGVC